MTQSRNWSEDDQSSQDEFSAGNHQASLSPLEPMAVSGGQATAAVPTHRVTIEEPRIDSGGGNSRIADQYSAEPHRATIAEDEAEQPSMAWVLTRELIETIVLSLIIFFLIRQVVQNYRIESHSMMPNFQEGQFILVNKLAYRLGEPRRGDVLVFNNPSNPDEDYIKRIIGLPGDTLEIRDQQVFINGLILNEPYIQNVIRPNTRVGPLMVEPEKLFVMGDNRPNSSDSRSFGQLSQDLTVGKAWVRIWPFDQFGLIEHYRGRLSDQPSNGP